jgi:SAM-dependent methyltransferase
LPEDSFEEKGNKYVDLTYGAKPFTNYPMRLSKHLADRFRITPGQKLLDLGCGRGEFLKSFVDIGLDGYGFDQSDLATASYADLAVTVGNLEERLPYEDESFDVVFSKSVVEHFYFPEKILSEVLRVLKPGGLIITMTPDWVHNFLMFHDDFTHRTPFTQQSLQEIHLYCGFEKVQTEKFIQLPSTWGNPFLSPLVFLTRKFLPSGLKQKSKWVRFSKEVMLLTFARKPMD